MLIWKPNDRDKFCENNFDVTKFTTESGNITFVFREHF